MDDQSSIATILSHRGVSRRQFIKFCGAMAAALALPASAINTIAEALAASARPRVAWLGFQDCTGDTESFLRAARQADPLQSGVTDPNIASLVLDILSVDYHETLMVPAGDMATKSRDDLVHNYPGQYICIVEGSIPMGNNGTYCTIGGRTALDIARQVCGKAKATIALGTCATSGGLPGANPNPTGAAGIGTAIPGLANLINLPGCPCNVVNLVATIVYLTSFGKVPPHNADGLPNFAFGGPVIHESCPRHDFYNQSQFVINWGDTGHRLGWCLYLMGCRGPVTKSNCPTVKWNEGTSWCVQAGHGCVGCTTSKFWDVNAPFYGLGPAPSTTPTPTSTPTQTTTPTKTTKTPTASPTGTNTPAPTKTPKPPTATPTSSNPTKSPTASPTATKTPKSAATPTKTSSH